MVKVFFSFLFAMFLICDFAYANWDGDEVAKAYHNRNPKHKRTAVRNSELGKTCDIKKVETYGTHRSHYRIDADCINNKGDKVHTHKNYVFEDDLSRLCNVDGTIRSAEYCIVKNSRLGKNCNIKGVHTYHGHTQHYRVYADCKNEKGKLVDAFKEHVYKHELHDLCNVNGVITKPGEEGCKRDVRWW